MSTVSGVDMGGAFLSTTSSVALIECAISVSTACNVDRVYPFSTSSTVDVQGVYCISLSTGCCMDVQGVSNLHRQQCGRAGCIQPTPSAVWTSRVYPTYEYIINSVDVQGVSNLHHQQCVDTQGASIFAVNSVTGFTASSIDVQGVSFFTF